jgi:hypothetical protein
MNIMKRGWLVWSGKRLASQAENEKNLNLLSVLNVRAGHRGEGKEGGSGPS